ncbi:MAG: hypothetical protein WBC51_20410 [Vicinamibacterales bacterium]
MNTGSPVAVLLAVALAAELIRLLERHRLATGKMQPVAIVGVVAVETPPMFLVVFQDDVIVRVDELTARPVRRQVFFVVTLGTGKNTL